MSPRTTAHFGTVIFAPPVEPRLQWNLGHIQNYNCVRVSRTHCLHWGTLGLSRAHREQSHFWIRKRSASTVVNAQPGDSEIKLVQDSGDDATLTPNSPALLLRLAVCPTRLATQMVQLRWAGLFHESVPTCEAQVFDSKSDP